MNEAMIALPRIVRIGAGVSCQVGDVLHSLGLSRPLLLSDAWLRDNGKAGEIESVLRAAGLSGVRTFCDTVAEPTIESIDAAIAFLRQSDHDCVIGFGGGSVIDSAKAVAVLASAGDRIDGS